MNKRITSWVVAAALTVGMLPSTALAAITMGTPGAAQVVTPTNIQIHNDGEDRKITVTVSVDNSGDAWDYGTVAGKLVTNKGQVVESTADVFDDEVAGQLTTTIVFTSTLTGCEVDKVHSIKLYDMNVQPTDTSATEVTFSFDSELNVKEGWDSLPPSSAPTGTTTVTLAGAGATDGTGAVVSGSTGITLTATNTAFSGTGSYKWFGPDGSEITNGVSTTSLAGDTLTIATYTSANAGDYIAKPYNTETGKEPTIGEASTFGTKTLSTTKITQPTAVTITGGTSATYGTDLQLSASGGDTSGTITWAVTSGNATITATGLLTPTNGTGDVVVTATKPGNADYEDKDGTATITLNKKELSLAKNTLEGSVAQGDTSVDLRTKGFVTSPVGLKTLAEASATLNFAVNGTGNDAGASIASDKDLTWSTGLTEDKTSKLNVTMVNNDYYTLASAAQITFTAKLGKPVTVVVGTPAPENNVEYYDTTIPANLNSLTTDTDALVELFGLSVTDDETSTPIVGGTWAFADGTTVVTPGSNTITLTWTGPGGVGNPYAPVNHDVTLKVKKTLSADDVEVSAAITKEYDAGNTLPVGAALKFKDAAKDSATNALPTITAIAGTYETVNVENGIALIITTVTAADNDYYHVAVTPADVVVTGNITQASAVTLAFTPATLAQTAGSITDPTVTSTPASADLDAVVEYEVPVPGAITLNNALCDCLAVEKSAHIDGCPGTGCTCPATEAVPAATKHTAGCAYSLDQTADCDCTVRSASSLTEGDHADSCAALVHGATSTEWLALDGVPTDVTLGATVQAWLNAMTSGTVNVRAYSNASTNLAAVSSGAAITGTLTISAAPVYSGGGGVSSYTVTYNVGEHGKLAEGAKKTESVNYKKSPSKVPEVIANEGYKFLGWSLDGKTVVNPTAEIITKSITFTALYEESAKALAFDKTGTEPYIKGVEENGQMVFKPDAPMTRGEVAVMLVRVLNQSVDSTKDYATGKFADLRGDEWYAQAVGYLAELGVMKGSNGTCNADQYITRAEFVALVMRIDGIVSGENSFADVNASDYGWAVDAIVSATAKGYIGGDGNGNFLPSADITRASVVKIMNGILGWSGDTAGEMPFADVAADHWAYNDIVKASTGK